MRRRIRLIAALAPLAALLVAVPIVRAADLDAAFDALKAYDWGQGREPLGAIETAVYASAGKPAVQADLQKRLVAVLESDASRAAKQFACRRLSLFADAKVVPVAAKLLTDPDLSHMGRMVLERVPDPSAAKALRDALPKTEDALKVGVLNSLGAIEDGAAVPLLVPLMKASDAEVADAAAAALGRIGTPDAASALMDFKGAAPTEIRPTVIDALLDAARALLEADKVADAGRIYDDLNKPAEAEHVRAAAFRGLVGARPAEALPRLQAALAGDDESMRGMAGRLIRETPGTEATKTFAGAYTDLPPAGRAALIEALGARGDPAARAVVVQALAAEDDAVRLAALEAAGRIGSAKEVPALAKATASGKDAEAEAARAALAHLAGADVNAALLAEMAGAPPVVRAALIQALAARGARLAAAPILAAAADADAGVRTAAFEALQTLSGEKEVPELARLVKTAPDEATRDAAEAALVAACGRTGEACARTVVEALPGAEPVARFALLHALARAGGDEALSAVAAATKDDAPAVRDEAVRVLSTWPDASAVPHLVRIAESGESLKHKVLAVQGYVRLAQAQKADDEMKLRMFTKALELAPRPEEKRLAIGALGNVKTADALRAVMPYLADPTLGREAATAAVSIGDKIAGQEKDLVREAMEKVTTHVKDRRLEKKARELLGKIGPKPLSAAPSSGLRLYAAPLQGAARDDAAAEKLGWKLGVQTYTFRKLTFFETLDRARELGLKYVEIWPGQKLSPDHPKARCGASLSDEQKAAVKAKLAETGITPLCIGVTGCDESMMAFAKEMGIGVIVTETKPTPELDAKLGEMGLRMALHNHPKSWHPDEVLAASKGLSDRVGACADTGHWMRRDLRPVETLNKLEGRIVSLHLKDLDGYGKAGDVPWGTGEGDARGMLEELARQGWRGPVSIEYERGSVEELMTNLARCIAWFDQTCAEIVAQQDK